MKTRTIATQIKGGVFARTLCAVGLAAILVGTTVPAVAGTLYSNGPVDGYTNAWDIKHGSGNSVSDSFKLTAPTSIITEVHFGEWTEVEALPSSVHWAIGNMPFTAGLGSGTAAVTFTSTHLFYNNGCCDVFDVGFAFSGITLSPGTYWLTLSDGVGCGPFGCGGQVRWDENSGVGCGSVGCPSLAYFDNSSNPIASESFYVEGSTTPEPGTLALLGSGVLGLGGVLRRRFLG